ncbi:MAG TPA: TerB family tellurite resistance protein [Kofleriaceae bacterium]|nr:TerB family tellurite resistance protein [Kofleriaceae bacterium]
MNTNVAKCLLVSKVLVADGMMAEDEREFLANMMTKLGLSDAEKRSVIELEGLDDAEKIVDQLSEDERRAIVELLVDAASADGRLSPHELATVKRVSAALKLNS